MDCKNFKENSFELFENYENENHQELRDHLRACSVCSKEFEENHAVLKSLKPKIKITANINLKQSVINHLKNTNNMTLKKNINIKRLISIAAIILVVLAITPFINISNSGLFVNTANSAERIFEKSLESMLNVHTMYINLKVRTIEQDNFELIGKEYDFVEHIITKTFDKPEKWKIKKPLREVAFDGKTNYLFIKNVEYAIKENRNVNFTSWMNRILFPAELYKSEIENAKNNKNCTYKVEEADNNIILTVESQANGNYNNPYLKNTSISDSDSKVVYTFSKNSYLLSNLKVFIKVDQIDKLVLYTEKIEYNKELQDEDFSIELPSNVEWKTIKDEFINAENFKNISSKEATKRFFEAMVTENWEAIEEVYSLLSISSSEKTEEFKSIFSNLKILSIGNSFKSGNYPGEFVPYKIKLSDGNIIEHNLALKKNAQNVWIIDGGI
ncbi:MAG TPA: hypothetical protein DDX39_00805 [Bacteroidales bacterium]|nr:MAG: hypothetical protein A2W98_08355 [Bacteroidetes bacterium GWF2_33_38]OFY76726.1 MAG: hypothetical protein A2265_02240 [Bacteroidetes bacterium RIFOXYA12_FULL_33_9]OFY88568.1 MAG: hypothetical protein A2236_00210 [Bacteroidetes bacterium RIFOXYA2_FULL_33_7]HBF87150.1 hypothetical protein [Bacteroidales bacterium]